MAVLNSIFSLYIVFVSNTELNLEVECHDTMFYYLMLRQPVKGKEPEDMGDDVVGKYDRIFYACVLYLHNYHTEQF